MSKNSKSLYDILGVSSNATKDQIISAFAQAKVALNLKRSRGEIETAEYASMLDELKDAYATLVNDEEREKYDEALGGSKRRKKTAKKKEEPKSNEPEEPAFEDEEEEEEEVLDETGATVGSNKKGKGILKKVATGAVVGVLGVSLLVGGIKLAQEIKKNASTSYAGGNPITVVDDQDHSQDNVPGQNQGQDQDQNQGQNQNQGTNDQDNALENSSNRPALVNYGDASNDAVVTEKATALLQELNAAGLFNMGTNAPYTLDEVKTLIQYMNGAYIPENEAEAYTLVNEFLNFALAPLNSEHVLFAVQYQGGEDSLKDTLQGYINNFHRVDIVDNMLLGDSTAYDYLKWFENQYYAMLCTTDRQECNRIYESLIQSLADMVYGDGFTLNGKVYDKNAFLGLDRVNSGNVLQMLVYMMEPFRTNLTKDDYIVTNKLLSGNPEEQQVTVHYLDVTEHFNAMCEDELHDIAVDDDGLILVDQPDGKNFAYINQVNTINRALMAYYGKTDAYTNVYGKSLNN